MLVCNFVCMLVGMCLLCFVCMLVCKFVCMLVYACVCLCMLGVRARGLLLGGVPL